MSSEIKSEGHAHFSGEASSKSATFRLTLERADSGDAVLKVHDNIHDGYEHVLAEVHVPRGTMLEFAHPAHP